MNILEILSPTVSLSTQVWFRCLKQYLEDYDITYNGWERCKKLA